MKVKIADGRVDLSLTEISVWPWTRKRATLGNLARFAAFLKLRVDASNLRSSLGVGSTMTNQGSPERGPDPEKVSIMNSFKKALCGCLSAALLLALPACDSAKKSADKAAAGAAKAKEKAADAAAQAKDAAKGAAQAAKDAAGEAKAAAGNAADAAKAAAGDVKAAAGEVKAAAAGDAKGHAH